jgi:hypothetical protein
VRLPSSPQCRCAPLSSNVRPHICSRYSKPATILRTIEARSLSVNEVAVIKAALKRAPLGESCEASHSIIEELRVVGECECGCDSLYFSGFYEANEYFRVADGLAYAEDGDEIGIMIWASGDQIVHLDLWSYSDRPTRLPSAETVCPFEESRRMRD